MLNSIQLLDFPVEVLEMVLTNLDIRSHQMISDMSEKKQINRQSGTS